MERMMVIKRNLICSLDNVLGTSGCGVPSEDKVKIYMMRSGYKSTDLQFYCLYPHGALLSPTPPSIAYPSHPLYFCINVS